MAHMLILRTLSMNLRQSTITTSHRAHLLITDGHTITIHTDRFELNETGHLLDARHGPRIAEGLRHV